MKNFKFPLFLLAMAIAIGGAIAAVAPAAKEQPKFTVYHYTSTSDDIVELKKISNWQGGSSSPSCDEDGTIPCTMDYSGNFQAYLNSFSNANDLIDAASTRRTP